MHVRFQALQYHSGMTSNRVGLGTAQHAVLHPNLAAILVSPFALQEMFIVIPSTNEPSLTHSLQALYD